MILIDRSTIGYEARPTFRVVASLGSSDASAAGARLPMDCVCVLDVSGSMSGAKIINLKRAVRFLQEELVWPDRLSIVSFNSQYVNLDRDDDDN